MLLYMLLEPTDCVHIDQKFSPDTVDKNTFGKKRKYVSKKIFDTHFYIARNAITSKQKKKKKKKEKRKNDVT